MHLLLGRVELTRNLYGIFLSSFLAKSDSEVKKKGEEKKCCDPYLKRTCPAILGISSLET